MVTLYRPPASIHRLGPVLEPYQVILRPLITEKATHLAERHNAYTFEVHGQANKTEIKAAVESSSTSRWPTSGRRTARARCAAPGSKWAGCGTGRRRSWRSTTTTGLIFD